MPGPRMARRETTEPMACSALKASRAVACRYVLSLIALLITAPCLAAPLDLVMESLDIQRTQGNSSAEIYFNQPVMIVSHCPASAGVFCEVELQLNGTMSANTAMSDSQGTSGATPDIHETRTPPQPEAFPLSRVDYYQNSERRGRLTLNFEIPVTLSVVSMADRHAIAIRYESPALAEVPSAPPPTPPSQIKIITLKESLRELNPKAEKTILPAMRYAMYTTTARVDGKTLYRLQLGFFTDEEEAAKVLQVALKDYPQAQIKDLPASDMARADRWTLRRKRLSQQRQSADHDRHAQLMERARLALVAGDNQTAIRAYSSVVQSNDPEYVKAALEYLGVARERNQQFAHAKAEYEEFLRRYPEGEASARVKQRLEGLLTARTTPKATLKASGKSMPQSHWESFGSLSQFYLRQESRSSSFDEPITDASLNTTFNFFARQRNESHIIRTDIVTSHHKALLDTSATEGARIYTLSAELTQRQEDYSIKAGRQSVNGAGIYGRFDGIHYTHSLQGQNKVGVTAGYPVDYSVTEGVNNRRNFFAAHFSTATRDKVWHTRLYMVGQRNDGLMDRRAVGVDLQYFRDGTSLYGIVDYDVYFKALNQATLMSNWRLASKGTFGLTADYRKSPLLTLNNALIGQTETLAGLEALYGKDQLKQLASDRTTAYRALTLSYSQPFKQDKYQFNADLSISNLGGNPASGGVEAVPAQGTEYFFSTQMVGNNIFDLNDISLAGLRYSKSDTGHTSTLTFSTRLPAGSAWRFNPRLGLSWRKNSNGSTQQTVLPSIIIDYRLRKSLQFQLEASYDRAQTTALNSSDDQSTYYLFAGYIYEF